MAWCVAVRGVMTHVQGPGWWGGGVGGWWRGVGAHVGGPVGSVQGDVEFLEPLGQRGVLLEKI